MNLKNFYMIRGILNYHLLEKGKFKEVIVLEFYQSI